MKTARIGPGRFYFVVLLLLVGATSAAQTTDSSQIPSHFKLDIETSVRLRPQLTAQSSAALGRYATGEVVFDRLLKSLAPDNPKLKLPWQLRIVENGQLNAYSSPDGGVYVESGLAKLAGPSAGLWAAILSHEIAHVVRRDWARRYLYQKHLERGGGSNIVLGDPGLPGDSWMDSEKASEDLGRFCRQLELQADRDGLMLMARAGYHPDFVPSLHHLLHAEGVAAKVSLYAMHPCWEERDRELRKAYVEAAIEFEHLWGEAYASPGGNPPVVVFADAPVVRKTGGNQWQIRVPLQCENLAGAVEVVLTTSDRRDDMMKPDKLPEAPNNDREMRQVTGCTSPTTTVVFTLTDIDRTNAGDRRWSDLYVIDAAGAVLARADLPKMPR